jgi:HAD superfamily hydrolase (TIGR01459 family)
MRHIEHLHVAAERYSEFIFDQWGVLHNGVQPLPGAVSCLEELKQRGKTIFLLSNSSKTSAENASKLEALGFARTLFDFVVTSGEILKRTITQNAGMQTGNCYVIGSEQPSWLGDTHVRQSALEQADFIILCSLPHDRGIIQKLMPDLERAAKRALPMLCANPDLVAIKGGEFFPASGEAARAYEGFGGKVTHFGKPHKIAYAACLAESRSGPGGMLMIGDSLGHDIRGANLAGIDSVFISSGVHKNDLPPPSSPAFLGDVEHMCARHDVKPQWLLAQLQW